MILRFRGDKVYPVWVWFLGKEEKLFLSSPRNPFLVMPFFNSPNLENTGDEYAGTTISSLFFFFAIKAV